MQSVLVREGSLGDTSILAEAIRNNETMQSARERVNAAAHVAAHYRAIALPALAAAAQRIAQRRKATLSFASTIILES